MLEENVLNVNVFHLNDRPGGRAKKAVTLFSRVNVIIICLYYYDVIMSLTWSLVFKQFRRDFIIVWLAKSLFYIVKIRERLQYRYFGLKNGGPDMLLPLKPTG